MAKEFEKKKLSRMSPIQADMHTARDFPEPCQADSSDVKHKNCIHRQTFEGQQGDVSDSTWAGKRSRQPHRCTEFWKESLRLRGETPCQAAGASMKPGWERRTAREIQPSQHTHSPLPRRCKAISCKSASTRELSWVGARGLSNGTSIMYLIMMQCFAVFALAIAEQTPSRIEILQSPFNNPARQVFTTQPKVCLVSSRFKSRRNFCC